MFVRKEYGNLDDVSAPEATMSDQEKQEERVKELLEMAWTILIRRDQLLKLAGGLPTAERDRILQIAGDFEVFSLRIRGLADTVSLLAAHTGTPQERLASLEDLHARIEGVMKDLAEAGKALFEIAGPPTPKGSEQAH